MGHFYKFFTKGDMISNIFLRGSVWRCSAIPVGETLISPFPPARLAQRIPPMPLAKYPCTHASHHVSSTCIMPSYPQHGFRHLHWQNTHACGVSGSPSPYIYEESWRGKHYYITNSYYLCILYFEFRNLLWKFILKIGPPFKFCYFQVCFVILIYMLSLFLNSSHHL